MKIFILFAAAIILLFAVGSSKTENIPDNKKSEPACCSKNKCTINKRVNEPDGFYNLQFNPFHI